MRAIWLYSLLEIWTSARFARSGSDDRRRATTPTRSFLLLRRSSHTYIYPTKSVHRKHTKTHKTTGARPSRLGTGRTSDGATGTTNDGALSGRRHKITNPMK